MFIVPVPRQYWSQTFLVKARLARAALALVVLSLLELASKRHSSLAVSKPARWIGFKQISALAPLLVHSVPLSRHTMCTLHASVVDAPC